MDRTKEVGTKNKSHPKLTYTVIVKTIMELDTFSNK